MVSSNYFNDKQSLIRKQFDSYKQDTTKPEHSAICELYKLYDEAMSWFYAEERGESAELEHWRDQLNLAGIKAHKIYTKLKEKRVSVAYGKYLLKNRKTCCKCGPEKLEFHLHKDAVEDLLNFCIIGTADTNKLKKLQMS